MQPSSNLLHFNNIIFVTLCCITYYLKEERETLATLKLFHFEIENPLNMDHPSKELFDIFEDIKKSLDRFMLT